MVTGTTTVGIICNGGVVLATESQATMGNLVASHRAPKIHKITDHIAMTISGSVADAQQIIRIIRANVNLRRLELGRELSVRAVSQLTATLLFQNRLYPYITMLIVGGVDEEGPHIFTLDPLGSLLEEDKFAATGSGSVIAYGVLEDGYRENMPIEEAIELAKRAVKAARRRDIASGGKIQVAVITKDGIKMEVTE
ncbi:MAG: archaeal proteasome endopeptidase complex subunit beta [Candidatus Odinarchaeota archaeon]|nr:archaeal proteasome endopeptidase complex subunit beta [Candidatus Odinarchaeota archaeon]